MYDALIIGGGPGGLAAAVYLARQKIKFILFAPILGGQALLSSDVENYLGFHLLDGTALVKRFKEHLKDYQGQFDLKEGEKVERVEKMTGGFRVKTDKGEYETKSVLIATGAKHRELGIPGEQEFKSKGVTYCATCDAPLFAKKKVFVVGGGNSAMDAALFTAKYTSFVSLVALNPELKGDDMLIRHVLSDPSITFYPSTKTLRFLGKDHLEQIELEDKSGNAHTFPCDGAFIEIGLQPVADFIDFVGKDKAGQIIVDKFNATNVEGVFSAGDVTDVTEKQIAVAVGEGSKAALSIIKFLQHLKPA